MFWLCIVEIHQPLASSCCYRDMRGALPYLLLPWIMQTFGESLLPCKHRCIHSVFLTYWSQILSTSLPFLLLLRVSFSLFFITNGNACFFFCFIPFYLCLSNFSAFLVSSPPILPPFLSFGFLPASFEFLVSHNVAATPLWQEHPVCVPSSASTLLWLWLFSFWVCQSNTLLNADRTFLYLQLSPPLMLTVHLHLHGRFNFPALQALWYYVLIGWLCIVTVLSC